MGTVKETLRDQMEYDGVKRWHDAGYTGKGVVIWDMENDRAEHGQMTKIRCNDSAPGATVINATYSAVSGPVNFDATVRFDGKEYTGEEGLEEFIVEHNIKIMTRSVGGGLFNNPNSPENVFWEKMRDKHKLIMFTSAGNDGNKQEDKSRDIAIVVGACALNKNGKPRRLQYSETGPGLDFIDFPGFYSGTSFSAPYLAGKAALLVQKYGQSITQDDVYYYFKDHAEDLGDAGEDSYHGWGLVKMGDTKTTIIMQIGSKTMLVDGRTVELDQQPIQDTETWRTLVPLRAIAEVFGAEVLWDNRNKMVTIIK